MRKSLSFTSLPQHYLGYSLIGLLLVGSALAFVWNQYAGQDHSKMFYDAIRTSISSEGVTCEIGKQDNTNGSKQRISLDLTSKTDATSTTTLTDQGAKVVTEGIATKADDFVHYTSISAPGKTATGKSRDFSAVLGTWGKQTRADLGSLSLYDQAAFGGCIVPLADLPKDKVGKIMSDVEQNLVFKTNFAKAKRSNLDGKPVQSYEVSLNAPVYIKFMKQVAKVAGNKSLDKIDEETYAQRPPETVTFYINRSTHHLQQITNSGQKQTITFSDFGKRPKIHVPTKTISTVELQKRLESIK